MMYLKQNVIKSPIIFCTTGFPCRHLSQNRQCLLQTTLENHKVKCNCTKWTVYVYCSKWRAYIHKRISKGTKFLQLKWGSCKQVGLNAEQCSICRYIYMYIYTIFLNWQITFQEKYSFILSQNKNILCIGCFLLVSSLCQVCTSFTARS